MKIRVLEKPYEEVMALPRAEHKNPAKPSRLLHLAMRIGAGFDLRDVGFTYNASDLKRAGKGPWLVLMNHCSFLDFEILSKIMFPRTYQIVATSDGFVGKEWLMRGLGCIPTQKFVRDVTLIRDMKYVLEHNRKSVVLYPEASYSFDGTTTPLPRGLGRLIKALDVPVVMITTFGSFTRDPLYNNLQKRKVKVSARAECLYTADEVRSTPVEEMNARLDQAFKLDYFRWQEENGVLTPEPFRADSLNRVLFHCPHCSAEGRMEGKGTTLKCTACGKEWHMEENGRMKALKGDTEFPHIPDWYAWERDIIRQEVLDGTYSQTLDVDIRMMVDFNAIYEVGSGVLKHTPGGFVLDGCNGKLHYEQSPVASYSVYSDFFWYELGDVVCIGNRDHLFYCFPKQKDVVARIRIAAEEIYRSTIFSVTKLESPA